MFPMRHIGSLAVAYGQAQRKVYFYRVRPLADGGPEWKRAEVCNAIRALTGPDVYFDDGDQVNRAEVISTVAPHKIRFSKVRRDDLPGVDDGAGDSADLDLDDEAGLIEAIHLVLFKNGIIGAEFFYYGPRVSRFERYLNQKLDLGPFEVCELIRNDVIDRALDFSDIRLLRIKFSPSVTSQQAAAAANLDGAMKTATTYGADVYADITLRAERHDDGFKQKVKDLLLGVKRRTTDVEIFDKLEIQGQPTLDSAVTSLDLLSERMYRTVDIPYRAERHRALNSDAAFDAIKQAYKEVKDQIPRDGLA